jgi:hypothetical protein
VNVDGEDLQVVAWVVRWATPRLEREHGHPDYGLCDLARRLDLAARADRFTPSAVAAVTDIRSATSFPRCEQCGKPPADRLRRLGGVGLRRCDRCYRDARRRGNSLAG